MRDGTPHPRTSPCFGTHRIGRERAFCFFYNGLSALAGRGVLRTAWAGAAWAASGVFSGGTLPASADPSQGGGRGGRYVPPVKFGLGGVPFGNEFEVVSDEDGYQ